MIIQAMQPMAYAVSICVHGRTTHLSHTKRNRYTATDGSVKNIKGNLVSK